MTKFDERMPTECPPLDAEQVDRDLFKAIDGNRPKEKDFKSFAEREREGIDPKKCDSWGLSVWPDMDAVEHALDAIPHFQRKRIIKFSITKADGRLKYTPSKKQPDHHTFWKSVDCNLMNSCEVVITPDAV